MTMAAKRKLIAEDLTTCYRAVNAFWLVARDVAQLPNQSLDRSGRSGRV